MDFTDSTKPTFRPDRPTHQTIVANAIADAKSHGCTCVVDVEITDRRVGPPVVRRRHDPDCIVVRERMAS